MVQILRLISFQAKKIRIFWTPVYNSWTPSKVVTGLVMECQALMAMQTFPSQIEWWDDVMYAGALFEVIPERQ